MSKMRRTGQLSAAVILLSFVVTLIGCIMPGPEATKEDPQVDKNADRVIAGPDVGIAGNDNDQLFGSLTILSTKPATIFAGSEGNGIFKSTDGGVSWKWLRQGIKFSREFLTYPEIYDMAIDQGGEIVYAAAVGSPGPPTGDYPSSINGVYKSVDGGNTWKQKVNGLDNSSVGSLAIDPKDPGTIYIGTKGGKPSFTGSDLSDTYFNGGIFKSIDGGETWRKLKLPAGSKTSEFWRIILVDSRTIFALGLNGAKPDAAVGIIKSTDGGTTWTTINPVGPPIFNFDVSVKNPSVLYAVGRDDFRIFKSEDGGASWTSIQAQANGPIRLSATDPDTVFFADAYGIYKSEDGLASSHKVLDLDKTATEIEFDSNNPEVVYASTGGLLIYKSVDGGETFVLLANLREFIDKNKKQ